MTKSPLQKMIDAGRRAVGGFDPARPLVRRRRTALVGGVCAGLAAYVGWDATLVRVLAVLAAVFTIGVPALLVYGLLWLVMPSQE